MFIRSNKLIVFFTTISAIFAFVILYNLKSENSVTVSIPTVRVYLGESVEEILRHGAQKVITEIESYYRIPIGDKTFFDEINAVTSHGRVSQIICKRMRQINSSAPEPLIDSIEKNKKMVFGGSRTHGSAKRMKWKCGSTFVYLTFCVGLPERQNEYSMYMIISKGTDEQMESLWGMAGGIEEHR